MTDTGGSLWPRLADLTLEVEACTLTPTTPQPGDDRRTTLITLTGGGHDGRGEDVSIDDAEHPGLHAAGPHLPLAGSWTLERFCDHLGTLEQWTAPPDWAASRNYRNWAYEAAALDLALRQAGRPLHEVLGREPRPLSFVNSFGMHMEPDVVRRWVHERLDLYPGLRFKLDVTPAWPDALMAELQATGAVLVLDFKGQYGLEVEDEAALLDCYDRVLAAFPDAQLEDPHDLPGVTERLAPLADRVVYDAPIHGVADLDATPLRARSVNVKPCRTGSLRSLLALYAEAEKRGLAMYAGGMGELDVGRGQAQLLAATFHPDGSNDIAPTPYNAEALSPGLPTAPLDPAPDAIGFRRAAG